MQELVVIRSVLQHPLMIVLGVLAGAGAAKSGLGTLAVGGILILFPIYFGAVATFMTTRPRVGASAITAISATKDVFAKK